MTKKNIRTTQGLRDILFEEIEELKGPDANPEKSMTIANLAKQIINTAKVELDFTRFLASQEGDNRVTTLGNLRLGSE